MLEAYEHTMVRQRIAPISPGLALEALKAKKSNYCVGREDRVRKVVVHGRLIVHDVTNAIR